MGYNWAIMHNHPSNRILQGLSLVLLLALLAGCIAPPPTVAPSATPSLTPEPPTATASSTATLTLPPTATFTPQPTASATITPTATLTPTPTLTPAARIPIIEYHDPDFKLNDQVQMTTAWFEEQIRWLYENGFHTLSGDDLAAFLDGTTAFPQKSVVLTFDVGTAKKPTYTDIVLPILRKYKFDAVFFILANDTVVTDDCKKPKHFCWNDFKQWADEGLVTIASHGLYHPDFTKLTPNEIKYELETAKKVLIEKTGRVPVAFAFPFDNASEIASTLTRAAGYQFAVAGNTRKELAAAPNDPDRFKLPRVYPYSNPLVYPNLTGFNHPFAEVITNLTRPGPVVSLTITQTTPISGGASKVDKIIQFCKGLPTETTLRLTQLLQSTFESDVSLSAQAKLPGLTTSVSCNLLPNNKPEAIVIHYTVGELTASMYGFRQPNGTSAHYLIDRDGKVVQMVPESLAALHSSCTNTRGNCVASCPICDDAAGNLTEPYMRSIGIEMVNRGHVPDANTVSSIYEDFLRSFTYTYWEDYTPAQIDALRVLVTDIAARWKIPIDERHILGHYRINQKVDPGPALNLFWTRSGNPQRPPVFELTPTPARP